MNLVITHIYHPHKTAEAAKTIQAVLSDFQKIFLINQTHQDTRELSNNVRSIRKLVINPLYIQNIHHETINKLSVSRTMTHCQETEAQDQWLTTS